MSQTPQTGTVSSSAILEGVLDELIQRFGGDEHTGEIAEARKLYDERRGRVFEDEELWERWTQAFLEWYAVERVLGGHDYPPAGVALAGADAARAEVLRAWLTSHRSVFEVRALKSGRVELLDLIGGGEFSVVEQRAMLGVVTGNVVEARLIGYRGDVLFGRTFCFHPAGTREPMVKHIRALRAEGTDRRDIIDFCANLRIRCERYRHVPAPRVYEQAKGLRSASAGAAAATKEGK